MCLHYGQTLNRIKSEKLEGIVTFHEIMDTGFYKYLSTTNIPIVSTLYIDTISAITINEKKAAYEAVNHLINLGHRNINMICGTCSFDKERMKGYFEALAKNDISQDKRRIVFEPQCSFEGGRNGMRELLLRGKEFSAVFATSDELAIGAIRTLKDQNLKVPQDISVVGFGDIEVSDSIIPRLTTVHQPIEEIGERTVEVLHKLINGSAKTREDYTLPHKLIIRESTLRLG